ncbi:hypothetical protein E2I00_001115, partial [Balaenoptera physalus]
LRHGLRIDIIMASDLDYYRILRLHGFVHRTLPSAVDILKFQCQELEKKGCLCQSKSTWSFLVVIQGFTASVPRSLTLTSVTITVTNSDTVNDVINMSLSKLGITGVPHDSALHAHSGGTASSTQKAQKNGSHTSVVHLLTIFLHTGHEHPYGIKMSHFQLLCSCSGDRGLPPEAGVPRDSSLVYCEAQALSQDPSQESVGKGSGQKTVKRSSVKNWAFWQSSSTREDNQCPAPPPTKPKQLFGVSLEDVPPEEGSSERASVLIQIYPQHILSFINQKGPLTEGIFRKSASIKSCRALKEKLNSGDKVNLHDESILMVASILKDFLQNIQGSVFSASLYDKWLGVTDQGNEEEKITATQSCQKQCSSLVIPLWSVTQHSSSNQMTAYNLSISFVQFLTENCLKIFGEDIISLLEESSMSCDNSAITDYSEKAAVTTKQPLESKPVRVIVIYKKAQLQDDAKAPSSMGPPSYLSTIF